MFCRDPENKFSLEHLSNSPRHHDTFALTKSIGVDHGLRGLRDVVSATSIRALGMSWALYIPEDLCVDMVGIQKNELFTKVLYFRLNYAVVLFYIQHALPLLSRGNIEFSQRICCARTNVLIQHAFLAIVH